MANYSLDEAAALITEKVNKPITARQIRELAIKGLTNLCFLYRGKATNCGTEVEEDIYGWPYVLPGYITEMEMKGSYPANMFIFNDTIYKILSPNFAVTLTSDKLLIDEAHVNELINSCNPSTTKEVQPKFEKKQVRQERLILETVKELGYDSQKLPKYSPGKAGVRNKVKNEVTSAHKSDFVKGSTVFDKAWDRLLKSGKVAYIK